MSMRQVITYDVGTASANGAMKTLFCKDFKHLTFTITASSSFAGTIAILGTEQEAVPTITSAASATNQYSPIQVVDLDNDSPTNGSTKLVYAGASDGTKTYEINSNVLQWVGFLVSGYSAGSVKITATFADNQ